MTTSVNSGCSEACILEGIFAVVDASRNLQAYDNSFENLRPLSMS